jgi:hypothetical protein
MPLRESRRNTPPESSGGRADPARRQEVKLAHRCLYSRSIPALATAVLAAFLLVTAALPAGAGLTFSCDPPSCAFVGPDTLDAYIGVDASVTDLQGFSLLLEYDPTIITPVAFELTGLTTGACFFSFFPSAAGSTIALDGAGLGCSVDGPGNLLRIRFVGANEGYSPLVCLSSILRDPQNQEIAHTCPGTTIQYTNPVPVERTSWSLIKTRY